MLKMSLLHFLHVCILSELVYFYFILPAIIHTSKSLSPAKDRAGIIQQRIITNLDTDLELTRIDIQLIVRFFYQPSITFNVARATLALKVDE